MEKRESSLRELQHAEKAELARKEEQARAAARAAEAASEAAAQKAKELTSYLADAKEVAFAAAEVSIWALNQLGISILERDINQTEWLPFPLFFGLTHRAIPIVLERDIFLDWLTEMRNIVDFLQWEEAFLRVSKKAAAAQESYRFVKYAHEWVIVRHVSMCRGILPPLTSSLSC